LLERNRRGFTEAHLIQKISDAEIGFETVEAMSAKADIALHHLENFLSGRGHAKPPF
jgi:hypothetical protein